MVPYHIFMAEATSRYSPHRFLDALHQYVRSPLYTASSSVRQEQDELAAERRAFADFAERLATLTVDREPVRQPTSTNLRVHTRPTDSIADVRAAYRETVMAVLHYDRVYDESLLEHVSGELGPELAQSITTERTLPLTASLRNALQLETQHAIQSRRAFNATLDAEHDSIERARGELLALVRELDSTTIPNWYRDAFVDRLDAIAADRQETLQERSPIPYLERDALCAYLYAEHPWRYPVLTAVTRVRESVALT